MLTKFKNLLLALDKLVPLYSIIPLVTCFAWNTVIYYGVRLINEGRYHYDLTTAFDERTPVVPGFIFVYFGCFLSWGIFYIMCGRANEDFCYKFAAFDILTRTICALIFIILPTCNVRPDISGNGISEILLRHLYSIDAADNLFPSIHCLVSWNCYVGLRNSRCYKKHVNTIAMCIAILVFASTLFTKQHVILDVISSVMISEASWLIVDITAVHKKVKWIFIKLNHMVFGKVKNNF